VLEVYGVALFTALGVLGGLAVVRFRRHPALERTVAIGGFSTLVLAYLGWFHVAAATIGFSLIATGVIVLLQQLARPRSAGGLAVVAIALGLAAVVVRPQAVLVLAHADLAASLPIRMWMIGDKDDGPLRGPSGYVFFHRASFFGPDPYCGYEFVPHGGVVEADPLGSGQGVATPLLFAGWHWICAS
jgi:hypothetical protein